MIIITAIVSVIILIIAMTSMGASEATLYYIRTLCLAIGGLATLILFLFGLSKKEDSEKSSTSKSNIGKEEVGFKTASSSRDQERPITFKLDLRDIYPPVLGIDLANKS